MLRAYLMVLWLVALAPILAVGKNVFAHFMAANSESYSVTDWENEINAAASIGIQGFVLNTAGNSYEPSRIADAYSVAEARGFLFFFSFDFAFNWDVASIATLVSAHAHSPSTFKWNGKVLISSFRGEEKGDAFWASLRSTLAGQGIQISLAPAFISFRDPGATSALLAQFPAIDGFMNWSWPQDDGNLLTTDTDKAYQAAIKSSRTGPFIMSVSPWQFKNLGSSGGNLDNDWVELSDTLWKYRWEQAINDVVPDIVEIVTWNDYAESQYIGAVNSNVFMDGDAHAYVDGMDHTGWQIIAKHYISWYLNGSPPAVEKDQVVVWYRLHPKDANCATPSRPRNFQFPADAVFGVALLTSPATVTMDIGLNNHFEWNAPAGVSIGQVPFPQEDSQIPFIQIIRNNNVAASGFGSAFFTKTCQTYNFNAFVGVVPNV
ncbi:Glycoside hydrolase family 71 [Pleurotus pulmonarius]